MRHLPPCTLTALRKSQRRRGRIEGSAATLLIVACMGTAVVAMTPDELYLPAAATPTPLHDSHAMHYARVLLPPCTDWAQKDCMALADDAVHPIPEPGTVALIGAALAGLVAQRARQ
jgi:hypothetical protein